MTTIEPGRCLDQQAMDLATETAIPYQTLINMYLKACAVHRKQLRLEWRPAAPGQPGSGRTAYEQNLGYQYDAAHYILVMGKNPEGRYLVADPLSRKGVVELTAAELASFEPHFGTEVWR